MWFALMMDRFRQRALLVQIPLLICQMSSLEGIAFFSFHLPRTVKPSVQWRHVQRKMFEVSFLLGLFFPVQGHMSKCHSLGRHTFLILGNQAFLFWKIAELLARLAFLAGMTFLHCFEWNCKP